MNHSPPAVDPVRYDSTMVDLNVRLPRRLAARLFELADDTNMPIQAIVLSALQTELRRQEPAN